MEFSHKFAAKAGAVGGRFSDLRHGDVYGGGYGSGRDFRLCSGNEATVETQTSGYNVSWHEESAIWECL